MDQLSVLGHNVIAEACELPNGCPRDDICNRKLDRDGLPCREQVEPFQTAEVALDVQPVGDIPPCIVHHQDNRTQLAKPENQITAVDAKGNGCRSSAQAQTIRGLELQEDLACLNLSGSVERVQFEIDAVI